MAIVRMDNVSIVVEDLDAMISFFETLGMQLEGKAIVEGDWADRVVDLEGQRATVAMLRTPGDGGRIELVSYETPTAIRQSAVDAPANTLGIRRVMFTVDTIDDTVEALATHGARLVGDVVQYHDLYRLCYLRGPEGILVGLAEELTG